MIDDLRKRSDDLLLACGWRQKRHASIANFVWITPKGRRVLSNRPHPYANAQDAIDLAEAMGLKIDSIVAINDLWDCHFIGHPIGPNMPTIAEAISAAIAEAVKEQKEGSR